MAARGINFIIRHLLFACIPLVLCLMGCQGHQAVPEQLNISSPPFEALPPPSDLPRETSYTDNDRFRLGKEYDAVLPTHLVGVVKSFLVFQPYYKPDISPLFNGLAYAMYRFDVAGYSDDPSVAYRWQSYGNYEDSLWLGLANWDGNSWEWFRCDESETLQLPSMDPYVNDSGQVVVVMVAYNPEQTASAVDYSVLEYVRLGARVGRWLMDVVASDPNVTMVSMKLDQNRIPHVAFLDYAPGSSKLLHAYQLVAWNLDVVDDSGDVGLYPSLVLIPGETRDAPLICYRDNTGNCLRMVSADWYTSIHGEVYLDWGLGYTIIDVPNPHACSLAIMNDTFCISYHDFDAKTLNYVYFNGLDWIDSIVDDSADVGFTNCMVENPSHRPAISYRNEDEQSLKFAEYTGSSWNISTIDPGGGSDIGMVSCLKYGPDNLPRVCYDDLTHDSTLYAYNDGAEWHVESVFDLEAHSQDSSMVIDSEGVPHIATMDSDHNNLIHLWRDADSGDWLSETLDFGGSNPTGYCVSMDIDAQDRLYIAYGGYYKEGAEHALKFIYQLD